MYIENVRSIKIQLDSLGYPVNDYLLFDIVINHDSVPLRSYLQTALDQVGDDDDGPDRNFIRTMRYILIRMPAI